MVISRIRCPESIEEEAGWASDPVWTHWIRENFLLLTGMGLELWCLFSPVRTLVIVWTELSWLLLAAEDHNGRSQWPRGLQRRPATSRLLGLRVRISPRTWMSLCCECCGLLSRGLWDELITRPEESCNVSLSVIRCNNEYLHLQWVGRNRSV